MQIFIITGEAIIVVFLLIIIVKLNKMSEVNDQLLAEAQKTADSLQKIRVDIATLAKGINPTGGLTEQEAQDLLTKLKAISADAADVDALTPDPAPPTEPGA